MNARRLCGAMCLGVALWACTAANAGFVTGFESGTYNGSPNGVMLNGQDLFYQPVEGSDSHLVYTYAGNVLGFPQNPTGGEQFAGATGHGGGVFARSQRDVSYGDGTGLWSFSFDIAAKYIGELPSAQNLGSFSTQVFPVEATAIALARWTDPNTAANWNADYVWFDAGGTQLTEEVSDPGFQNLQTDHWYRWSTTFDFDSNLITEVSITDLTTNETFTNNPVGRYLLGGAGGAEIPTGFRLFAGASGVDGNTLGFDNVMINAVPAPATLALLALAGLAGRGRRR